MGRVLTSFFPGRGYLGGFIGSADSKEDWLNGKVADWAEAVETLAKIT